MNLGFIAMNPLGGGLLADATLYFRYLAQFPDAVAHPGIEKAEEMEEILPQKRLGHVPNVRNVVNVVLIIYPYRSYSRRTYSSGRSAREEVVRPQSQVELESCVTQIDMVDFWN